MEESLVVCNGREAIDYVKSACTGYYQVFSCSPEVQRRKEKHWKIIVDSIVV
jgi:hypothetical protein